MWGGEGRCTCRGGRREAGREGTSPRSFSSTPRLSSHAELIAFELSWTCMESVEVWEVWRGVEVPKGKGCGGGEEGMDVTQQLVRHAPAVWLGSPER